MHTARYIIAVGIVGGFLGLAPLGIGGLHAQPSDEAAPSNFRDALRARTEVLQHSSAAQLDAAEDPIHTAATLTAYYANHDFVPVWVTERGPRMRVHSLRNALRRADREGLSPADYHVEALQSTLAELRTEEDADRRQALLVDLEIQATEAFLLYGMHLLTGRVDPEELAPSWNIQPRRADLVAVLDAIATKQQRVHSALDTLRPDDPGYSTLVEALRTYRGYAEEGGWTPIDAGPSLKQEDQGERVAQLRSRLAITDAPVPDTTNPDTTDAYFDDHLHEAVVVFQERHGLTPDGVVGPATLRALNVSAEARAEQVRVNLERWRWLPTDLGARHVRVNIAAFELEVVEDDEPVLNMRVVVGRPYRQTPVFSDAISYLVLSPYWHVPNSIATRDKLPEFQRDPSLVTRQGFQVFDSWSAQAQPLDPLAINWGELSERTFPYRLRQNPSPANALGRVKFMFPNPHNVYLHDTPTRSTFAQAERGFSSGCIRLEHPLELAEYLLSDVPGWDRARIDRNAQRTEEATVVLPERVPVHLLYSTAWADADGVVHFRNDVYDRDKAVGHALDNEGASSWSSVSRSEPRVRNQNRL
ncbi:L,D-transpeptidase family protein [Longimonas halophila]|nr:L,D-transpeptidase family protein [Longimonas halophila]